MFDFFKRFRGNNRSEVRTDTGDGFEGLDRRHGTSSKQPAPNVQRDGESTIGVVFAGLSPYNKRPTPGFSPSRLEDISHSARHVLGSSTLPLRVFDPTEWKAKAWEHSHDTLEGMRLNAIRRAARKLKELGLPKETISAFRKSETTSLLSGPDSRFLLVAEIDPGTIDLGPLEVVRPEAESESESVEPTAAYDSRDEHRPDDIQSLILAYLTQDPDLPWFSVGCRFDSRLEEEYANQLRKRFELPGAPVVWVYPEEWPVALHRLEGDTDGDIHLRRTIAAAQRWSLAGHRDLGEAIISSCFFEVFKLEQVGLVLYVAPFRTYTHLAKPLFAVRDAGRNSASDFGSGDSAASRAFIGGTGRAALYVFEYPALGDDYGRQIFDEVRPALAGSEGVCAFNQGDLDIGPGGREAVVENLLEARDGGWIFTTHRLDGPLRTFGMEDGLEAYAVLVWTDRNENIERLHNQWREAMPHVYLGYLSHPAAVALPWLYEAFRHMNLVISPTFRDGQAV